MQFMINEELQLIILVVVIIVKFDQDETIFRHK